MRIEAYSQVQQIYGTSKVNKTAKTQKTTSVSDNLQISSIGKDIQVAKQAVKDAPDVREDVVAPIKSAIQNGTYDVSGEDFADKLLARLSESLA
ncbi:MAG: flagellar biosynthesis anti-sigma factor FlgM [Butyrivibrio sp.]|jgi:negative regulator of flagellin synthesis FlgM|uniref:flagellar biosynthesis anti-sigma factor FlgM n=1 Tax=Butyrivibrio sp. NC2002 TaxID=1410610 RepID=UPI0005608518|nr:flagellar biosynthesis anti-sigma factor FlgM [Butyrivibrio sp. NC2002]MBE5859784.1 flagellar biosynthesis anti-sigma factor FlgM [Butyrivibrio sp.]